MTGFPSALLPLAGRRQWIAWRWSVPKKSRNGKPTKMPCDLGGRAIDSSAKGKDNWRTYHELAAGWGMPDLTGVALAMAGNEVGDLLALDLDGCRDAETGAIERWAMEIAEACGSYAEVSPSGTGLRILGSSEGWPTVEKQRRWMLPGSGGKGETFFRSGFVTVTLAALDGFEGLWRPIGMVCDMLPRRTGTGEREVDGKPDGERKSGKAEKPIEIVRETLGFLPNGPDVRSNYARWDRVGMCVFRATSGSDEGLEAWIEWSARNPAHDLTETCEGRWEHWKTSSPPTKLGYGSLHRDTRSELGRRGTVWSGGPLFLAARVAETGMGALPKEVVPPLDSSTSTTHEPNNMPLDSVTQSAEGYVKPVIVASDALDAVADAAEAALLAAGIPVMQRGGMLQLPVLEETDSFKGERVPSPRLIPIDAARLADLLSGAADWVKWDDRKKGWTRTHPPERACHVLLSRRGKWRVPSCFGLSRAPVLRPDCSLFVGPGLDPLTGIYVLPAPDLRIDEIEAAFEGTLYKEHAEEALALLDALLDEFPFAEDCDRSVALSAMLTAAARPAMDLAPLHAFDGPRPGTGKSYLTALTVCVTHGRPPPVLTAGDKPEETEKRLAASMIAGRPVTVIDNLDGTLDGSFLCVMVEQRIVAVRYLGLSKDVEISNTGMVMANGNGIVPTGGAARRVLTCMLDPNVERPEERRFRGDPMAALLADRTRYLTAALTVVAAHARAGFPGVEGAVPLASFGDYTRLVRGALRWLGRADPARSMERARERDPNEIDLRDLMTLWAKRFGIGEKGARTAREIVETQGMPSVSGDAEAAAEARRMTEVLLRIAADRNGAAVAVGRLGSWLKRRHGIVVGNLKLVNDGGMNVDKIARWRVDTTLKVIG